MNIIVQSDALALGRAAADLAASKLNEALNRNDEARLVVSTGSSQFELFEALISKNFDWSKIEVFHLDEQCKLQQVNEGWFNIVDDVPARAVSMSVWQIMKCRTIISCVPHKVKADAVPKTFVNKLTNMVPATMLKQHPDYHLFLDHNSASGIITF